MIRAAVQWIALTSIGLTLAFAGGAAAWRLSSTASREPDMTCSETCGPTQTARSPIAPHPDKAPGSRRWPATELVLGGSLALPSACWILLRRADLLCTWHERCARPLSRRRRMCVCAHRSCRVCGGREHGAHRGKRRAG